MSRQRQGEEINEDDLDTVKQENTFVSKAESITSETYKDIQKPKYSKYFFEVPEEQNYNYIQGPIEFEYENSLDYATLNSKNENGEMIRRNNCSKLNNINIYKIEKKSINTEDDFVNYCDNMKENDELTMTNINNKINNVFNSISSINEKTISNNCSFSNFNLKVNNNIRYIDEIKAIKMNNFLEKNKEDEKIIHHKKQLNSYKKKVIKDIFDSNKIKSSNKASMKINKNFSQKKQKELLLYRLKNHKIKFFIDILKKIIIEHIRKFFNKFKNSNMKINQLSYILKKTYTLRYKKYFFNILLKLAGKNNTNNNSLYTQFNPFKNYICNRKNYNNYNMLNIDKDEEHSQTNPVPNDNDTLNISNSINDNNYVSSTLRNVYNKNNIFKKPLVNMKTLGEKTDSYFYVKKLLYPINTIPSTKTNINININNVDKNDYVRNKKIINNNKRNLIPNNYKKKTFGTINIVNYDNKYNSIKENKYDNNGNKKGQEEIIDNNIIKKKKGFKNAINADDNDDEIFEQAYKYKILDEERCSNGLFHRNIKTELDEHQKIDLKTYFLKEVEKLEFPDTLEKNEPNEGQENVDESNSN